MLCTHIYGQIRKKTGQNGLIWPNLGHLLLKAKNFTVLIKVFSNAKEFQKWYGSTDRLTNWLIDQLTHWPTDLTNQSTNLQKRPTNDQPINQPTDYGTNLNDLRIGSKDVIYNETRPDTRPISSRWRVGRGSNLSGQGQLFEWAGAELVGRGL